MNALALAPTLGPWRHAAACAEQPIETFFEPENQPRALALCEVCPVVRECFAFAMRTRQEYGVWGGTTPDERRRLREHDEAVRMNRAYKPPDVEWSPDEIRTLQRLAHLGAEAIAAVIGRSRRSVESKAAREGISLRRPGERRGRVTTDELGPSERASHLRSALATGSVAMDELEKRIRAIGSAPLCPRCGRRPIGVRNTGLCRPCHAKDVLEAYEDLNEGRATSRALDAARARRYRRRRRR